MAKGSLIEISTETGLLVIATKEKLEVGDKISVCYDFTTGTICQILKEVTDAEESEIDISELYEADSEELNMEFWNIDLDLLYSGAL